LETASDIQRELQAVLNGIKENDFHGALEVWKKQWDRKETIWRRWQPKLSKFSQHFFSDLVQELSIAR
jgi:hypothetical protein